MNLSKSAALRCASKYVSVSGRQTSWTVHAPYYNDQIQGPRTEINTSSYTKARAIAAAKKSHLALHLMGRATEDALTEMEWAHDNGCNNTVDLLAAGLSA